MQWLNRIKFRQNEGLGPFTLCSVYVKAGLNRSQVYGEVVWISLESIIVKIETQYI